MTQEGFLSQIVERIKKIDPEKIILFGSYASGTPDSDSDLDILVVTAHDYIPKNFSEKNRMYLDVSNLITDIELNMPIDLIVHTKPMHTKFIELGSSFSRKIIAEGRVIYEKNH